MQRIFNDMFMYFWYCKNIHYLPFGLLLHNMLKTTIDIVVCLPAQHLKSLY